MEEKKISKNKIIVIIMAVIILAISSFFIYKSFTTKEEIDAKEITITPLLYKVTKDGSDNVMYLFGSIHMANPNELQFPNYVLKAYNDSSYVACEIDETSINSDMAALQDIVLMMMYQDDTTIKDHISAETYNKLVEFLTKKNSYTSLYDYYKPMFFYSLLSNVMGNDSGLSAEAGIDNYFIAKAKEDGKEVLEVESMKFQTDLLLSFSDKLYEVIINDTIDNYDDSIQELKDLYDSWKIGDEKKILELNDEEIDEDNNYSEEIKKEIEEYNKKIVTDRNNTMTDKAIEYFENNQEVFFMVGTLHIIGEEGIANNLKEKGYIVTKVK